MLLSLLFSAKIISQISSNPSLENTVPVGFCGEHKAIKVALEIKKDSKDETVKKLPSFSQVKLNFSEF